MIYIGRYLHGNVSVVTMPTDVFITNSWKWKKYNILQYCSVHYGDVTHGRHGDDMVVSMVMV